MVVEYLFSGKIYTGISRQRRRLSGLVDSEVGRSFPGADRASRELPLLFHKSWAENGLPGVPYSDSANAKPLKLPWVLIRVLLNGLLTLLADIGLYKFPVDSRNPQLIQDQQSGRIETWRLALSSNRNIAAPDIRQFSLRDVLGLLISAFDAAGFNHQVKLILAHGENRLIWRAVVRSPVLSFPQSVPIICRLSPTEDGFQVEVVTVDGHPFGEGGSYWQIRQQGNRVSVQLDVCGVPPYRGKALYRLRRRWWRAAVTSMVVQLAGIKDQPQSEFLNARHSISGQNTLMP